MPFQHRTLTPSIINIALICEFGSPYSFFLCDTYTIGYRTDLMLLWTLSRTTVNPDWLQGTLGDVWRKAQANPLCVSSIDAK
jgi:hypothetical protein